MSVRMRVHGVEVTISRYEVASFDPVIRKLVEDLRNPTGESASEPDEDGALARRVQAAVPGAMIVENTYQSGKGYPGRVY